MTNNFGSIKFDCVDIIFWLHEKCLENGSRKFYKHDDYDFCHHVSMLVSAFYMI